MRRDPILLAAASAMGASCPSAESKADGKLICAPVASSCDRAGECRKETTQSLDSPSFLKIDRGKDGSTDIEGIRGAIVWNLLITAEVERDMTLPPVGKKIVFVAFDACTEE